MFTNFSWANENVKMLSTRQPSYKIILHKD